MGYQYDNCTNGVGRLCSITGAGFSSSWQYDIHGRVVERKESRGLINSVMGYQYDNCTNGVGRLCSITGAGFSSSWQYDIHGRVVERKESRGLINSVMGYQYNTSGQLATMTYPSGKAVSYQYNAGRLDSVSVNGTVILNQITYNAANQVTSWQWANGAVTWRSYDQDGRLVQQSLANLSRSLTYDAVGNILNINDGTNQYGYGYDPMNRLLSANNFNYGYDLNGNRLTGELNNYSYDPSSNKLLSVSGSFARNYQYDATGNAVSDGLHSYSYNAENQLAEVVGVASYLYNGLGQRVAKNVGGVLSHYAYDEQARLIGEYNAIGQVINETVYLFGQPIAVLKGADVFNVHTDHLGSPRKITNQTGAAIWSWAEKPFGDSPVNQDPDGDGVAFEYNLRFPGQFFDSETGLHYNYHRYYDSQTGRYITSDPIGLSGGLNTFGYVGGNPLSFVDLLGLDSCYAIGQKIVCITGQRPPPEGGTPIDGPLSPVGVAKTIVEAGLAIVCPGLSTEKEVAKKILSTVRTVPNVNGEAAKVILSDLIVLYEKNPGFGIEVVKSLAESELGRRYLLEVHILVSEMLRAAPSVEAMNVLKQIQNITGQFGR